MAIGTQLDAWLKSHVTGPVCRMVQRFLQDFCRRFKVEGNAFTFSHDIHRLISK